jgi:phosphonoacetaldehyde hydrolase
MNSLMRYKPYAGRVQAVILDWAGTAVDYGCVGPVAVFVEVFHSFGVEISTAEARAPMGLMKKDHIRAICGMENVAQKWAKIHGGTPGEDAVEAMHREMEPLMAATVARYSHPVPGLLEAVAAFRAQGVKLGSSTGYTRPIMEVLVPAAEQEGYRPDSIVCSSDVPAGRPYPWMCYQNAMNLQVFPFAAMVKIGDTEIDIKEGLNAGMWTIGVTKTGNQLGLTEQGILALDPEDLKLRLEQIEARFRFAGAHFIVESIGECPAIIERISACLAMGECP